MNKKTATHKVIDLHYTEDEGNVDYIGTFEECQEYYDEQAKHGSVNCFMLRIEPLSPNELEMYQSDEDDECEEIQ